LYNRAKIILNLHGNEFRDTETRIFEVLGSGGFLISEKLAEESPFVTGVHLVEVDSLAQLTHQIDYYLSHEDRRLEIAKQGYEAAHTHHTYSKRVQEMVKDIEYYIGSDPNFGNAVNKYSLNKYAREEMILQHKRVIRQFLVTKLKLRNSSK
jgi:spore maturation protein CgeB